MTEIPKEFLSNREREYLEGVHDDKYYQYKSNLRSRVRNKFENLVKDVELALGNERMDMVGDEFDWKPLVESVNRYQETLTWRTQNYNQR